MDPEAGFGLELNSFEIEEDDDDGFRIEAPLSSYVTRYGSFANVHIYDADYETGLSILGQAGQHKTVCQRFTLMDTTRRTVMRQIEDALKVVCYAVVRFPAHSRTRDVISVALDGCKSSDTIYLTRACFNAQLTSGALETL